MCAGLRMDSGGRRRGRRDEDVGYLAALRFGGGCRDIRSDQESDR